jgi:hypothetical protein
MTPQIGDRVRVEVGYSSYDGVPVLKSGEVMDYQRAPGATYYKVLLDDSTIDWYADVKVTPLQAYVSPMDLLRAAKGELEPATDTDAFEDDMLWRLGRQDWLDSLLEAGVD